MAKYLCIGVLLLISLVLINSTTVQEQFIKSNADFALNFYDHLSKQETFNGKSFVVSPYSIHSVGGLLYAGSGGQTAEQIHDGFKLISTNTTLVGSSFKQSLDVYADSPFMKILNKIYVMTGNTIEPKYKQIATDYFHTAVDEIDFAKNVEATDSINDWVSSHTNKKIQDLLQSDDVGFDTKMLLLNVIHFKGEWKYKFNVNDTTPGKFYKKPEESVLVDMMTITEKFKFTNYRDLSAMAVEIPFKGSDLSLFVIKPNSMSKNIHDLEEKLKVTDLATLFNKVEEMKISVTIPKFSLKSSVDLQTIFTDMGMPDMFGHRADFTNLLTSSLPLYVSKAVHKAAIEINEEGAEAAAATAISISFRTGTFHYVLNQPFIYFIKGQSNEIYFMGRYMGDQ